MSFGRTVRLFLVDGAPTGLMTAEIMNWSGHALVAPRSRLQDVLTRDEAERTGVYFLIGDDPNVPNQQLVYIGKSTRVGKRLNEHNNKDFWDRLCIFTSKDQNLTEAHVGYLESRLIAIATRTGRASIHNLTAPEYRLPESDTADMDFFAEQILLLLPVLGFDFLRELPRPQVAARTPSEATPPTSGILELELGDTKYGILAKALEVAGEIVVLAGSKARAAEDYASNTYGPLRQQLKAAGKLVPDEKPDLLKFSADVTFTSPSAAASVIFNRNDNGRRSWKVASSGKTLAEWQDERSQPLG